MEETYKLRELFLLFKKYVWVILAITLLITGISAIVNSFFLKPVYQSSTEILINQARPQEQQFNSIDVQTNLELINTYRVIIQSAAILRIVKDELQLAGSEEELKNQINVSNQQNSQVLLITVQDRDPKMAARIANSIATTFQKEVVSIMNIDNVKILTEAKTTSNEVPVKPRIPINIAISFLVGLMLSSGLAFLIEYMDNTIKTQTEVQRILDLPLLGLIPFTTEKDLKLAECPKSESEGKRMIESNQTV